MSKNIKKKIILMYVFLICWILVFVVNNCALYADGSYTVFEMLREEGFWLWWSGRKASMFLSRLFSVILMNVGCTNVVVLVKAYTFGCVFWPSFFLAIAFIWGVI